MRPLIRAGFLASAVLAPALSAEVVLPGHFIANRGQFDPGARFVARSGAGAVLAADDGFASWQLFEGTACGVRYRFGAAAVRGESPVATRYSDFRGAAPERFVVRADAYAAVRFSAVAPGVDLLLRTVGQAPEYDLELAPGASLDELTFDCEGASSLDVDKATGELVLETPCGPLRQSLPRAFAVAADGARRPLAVAHVLRGAHRFGFRMEPAGARERAILDPTISWTQTLGGAGSEFVSDLAVDALGDVYAAGETSSIDFPVTAGAFDVALGGATDGFVAKLAGDGTGVLWVTFLGGAAADGCRAVAIEPSASGTGDVYVAGFTQSVDFPATAGAVDTTYGGAGDAFVARLAANGSALRWATYLGGSGAEMKPAPTFAVVTRMGLGLDASGAAVVASCTNSPDFPVTAGAFDATYNDPGSPIADQFCARILHDGSALQFSTFFGGSSPSPFASGDVALSVAVRPNGEVFCVGFSDSLNLTLTPDSPVSASQGLMATFLRIPPSGLGATAAWLLPNPPGLEGVVLETARAVVLGADGGPIIATSGFVTTSPNGGWVGQLVRLDPSAAAIVARVGSGSVTDLTVAENGMLFGTGPAGGTTLSEPPGRVTRFGSSGATLEIALLPKGSYPQAVAAASPTRAVFHSAGHPTLHLGGDTYVSAADFCAGWIEDLGGSCAGPSGSLPPALLASGCPVPGQDLTFVLLDSIPAGVSAFLLVGTGGGPTPITPTCSLALSVIVPLFVPMPNSHALPTVTGTIPAGTLPVVFDAQCVLLNPAAIGAAQVSNAWRISVGG